jgi:capsular exopolysaccharide synthesis family protein
MRIFDALTKSRSEATDLVVSSIGETKSGVSQSPPAPAVVIPELTADTFTEKLPAAAFRSLPICVSASAPVLPFDSKDRSASEQYRIVRTKIIQHPKRPRMIVVSSGGPGDGKSITTVNLAGALSLKADTKVLLVDADFRRSSVGKLLGLPPVPGLNEVLQGVVSLEEAIIQTEQFPNLCILPAGGRCDNPVELLDSAAWPALCTKARELFKFIIVDSPPIAAVADYDIIQAACDGILVVARPDHTKRKVCVKALECVPKDKLIGVVLNCVGKWFLTKDYSYSGYYQGY